MLELSHINKELLYKVLATPSFSEKELRLQEFLMEYASQKDYECSIDDKGNIYMAKGKLSDGMNFGAGYYLYHTLNEYVVPEEMDMLQPWDCTSLIVSVTRNTSYPSVPDTD